MGALQLTAGDLAALNHIAGTNARYYVQVAAAPEEVTDARNGLRPANSHHFPPALKNGQPGFAVIALEPADFLKAIIPE